jgi:hypothetical protein
MNLSDLTDEQYFAELKTMFKTPGWQIFMAELQDNAININSVEHTTDGDNLFFRKGQLAVMGNLLNMEATMLRAEQEQADDASNANRT